MAYIVTESCIRCRYMDCIDPCPVECFHVGPEFIVIDPEVCIDCNLCVIECPVDAIYSDKNIPDNQIIFIDINRKLSNVWPVADISQAEEYPDADNWKNITNKKDYLLSYIRKNNI